MSKGGGGDGDDDGMGARRQGWAGGDAINSINHIPDLVILVIRIKLKEKVKKSISVLPPILLLPLHLMRFTTYR